VLLFCGTAAAVVAVAAATSGGGLGAVGVIVSLWRAAVGPPRRPRSGGATARQRPAVNTEAAAR
jgi:hypothetical protein